jgi:hypothetical protein
MPSPSHFTSGELGDFLGVQAWKISRLFELGIINEVDRVGGRRLIPRSAIPAITQALQNRGWLKEESEANVHAKSVSDTPDEDLGWTSCEKCGRQATHRHIDQKTDVAADLCDHCCDKNCTHLSGGTQRK